MNFKSKRKGYFSMNCIDTARSQFIKISRYPYMYNISVKKINF